MEVDTGGCNATQLLYDQPLSMTLQLSDTRFPSSASTWLVEIPKVFKIGYYKHVKSEIHERVLGTTGDREVPRKLYQ